MTDEIIVFERITVNVAHMLKRALQEVSRRQNTQRVGHLRHIRRAIDAHVRTLLHIRADVFGCAHADLAHPFGVVQRRVLISHRHHSFEIFAAHHRANAGTSRRAMFVVHDGCHKGKIFTRGSNTCHFRLLGRICFQDVRSLVRILAPHMRRRPDFDLIFVDPEIYRLRRLAFKDVHIKACTFHPGGKVASGI